MRSIVVALFLIGSMFGAALPATADTPGCVVRKEFRQVHNGLTQARVHRIFDTSGTLTSVVVVGGARHEVRNYRACHRPGLSFVSVHFSRGRVVAKFAIWR